MYTRRGRNEHQPTKSYIQLDNNPYNLRILVFLSFMFLFGHATIWCINNHDDHCSWTLDDLSHCDLYMKYANLTSEASPECCDALNTIKQYVCALSLFVLLWINLIEIKLLDYLKHATSQLHLLKPTTLKNVTMALATCFIVIDICS